MITRQDKGAGTVDVEVTCAEPIAAGDVVCGDLRRAWPHRTPRMGLLRSDYIGTALASGEAGARVWVRVVGGVDQRGGRAKGQRR